VAASAVAACASVEVVGRGEDEQTGLGIEVARLARGYGIVMQPNDLVAPRVISGQAAFVRWLVCGIHVD
jgi:hypothetical protein